MKQLRLQPLRAIGLLFASLVLGLTSTAPALADPYSDNGINWFNINASSPCSAAPNGGLSGGNNAMIVFNYLKGHGLSNEQAAGVVGNTIHESGIGLERLVNTPLNQRTSADAAENTGLAWGLVQWAPASKIVTPAKKSGKTATEIATFGFELDFLWNQLNTNERAALDGLKTATTPEDAAIKFSRLYERSEDTPGSPAEISRTIYARAVFELAVHNTPLPPNVQDHIANYGELGSTTLSGGSGCSTSTAGYANPFRDLKNSHSMRMDGGLDYGGEGVGAGPVYAVGNGRVVGVKTSGSGWPGLGTAGSGAYIMYQLSDGPAKDKFIYIAEDCTPKVKAPDTVTHDTVICDYKDQPNPSFGGAGTHLETGWSDGAYDYVKWSDYRGHANGYASNSGQDISKFLQKLGVAPGTVDDANGVSITPPPADWPRW